MTDYITPKLQSAFDRAGVHFVQPVIAGGLPGFVQGIRPDGKIIVSHAAKHCPPEWNVKFWKLIDYETKDINAI